MLKKIMNFAPKQQQPLTILLSYFLLLCCSASLAEETYYKVEVLAFKQTPGEPLSAEDWQGDTLSQQLIKATVLQDMTGVNVKSNTDEENPLVIVPIYQKLPEPQWELSKQHQALAKRQGYTILTHVAWIQPKKAKPIRLSGGELLNQQTEGLSDDDAEMLDQKTDGLADDKIAWEFDGIIKANRNHPRYFTVETNLALSIPVYREQSDLYYYDAIPEMSFQHYYLRQTQKLQSDELYYFDHPMFGLLVKVTPYKK